MSHLNALQLRLSNERMRLQDAKSSGERELRAVWVKQLEKEIQGEIEFTNTKEISDDELLTELMN